MVGHKGQSRGLDGLPMRKAQMDGSSPFLRSLLQQPQLALKVFAPLAHQSHLRYSK